VFHSHGLTLTKRSLLCSNGAGTTRPPRMAFLCILSYAAWYRAKVPLDAVIKRRLKLYEAASSKLLIGDILLLILEHGLAENITLFMCMGSNVMKARMVHTCWKLTIMSLYWSKCYYVCKKRKKRINLTWCLEVVNYFVLTLFI